MGQLSGKVAIVTGAGRGLGLAIARRFAAEGAAVGILTNAADEAACAVADIEGAGGRAIGVVCDVTAHDRIPDCVRRVADAFGPIDILVNNAHDTSDIFYTVDTITGAAIDSQFDSCPIAAIHFMRACYPHMKGRSGRIINMSSGAGIGGTENLLGYAMAKEALRALTRSSARAWGRDGITVNNISPLAATASVQAALDSGDLPPVPNALGRYGDPAEDIAPVALFLASDASRYVTGTTIFADGGRYIDAAR